ncbi:PA and RING finger domain protein [Rasamsonia emersonii CBS 393.64]|uniref:RING-type E3 ubiquitin transferase n=1 Tax=Rasamsonia emersonii (strain ATCC 16479 / CBS 393.64 / IMI 116815) TaxID=1408163 RepID=A0A0F4Z0X6_RASE3|nr:PA and RING finger domain protein [Rasamsonia emersonii CBS 393.64]KKA23533.1 PA and RING finger domain protein [Rasamsonia emersonii CBS 393.64]
MRPPRLLLLLFCFIFLPILLTFLSLLTAEPHRGADANAPLAGRTSRLRALFSFNAPASLFPPSAIISLTDDNSTFFLARPAAFGPLLPAKGLSGQLWVGSGFGDDTLRNGGATAGSAGELGCSDVPGWGEKDGQLKQDKAAKETEKKKSNSQSATDPSSDDGPSLSRRNDPATESAGPKDGSLENPPSADDGTDDHLHHPLTGSSFPGPSNSDGSGEKGQPATHADIQSLQESAEIAGKVVLLSRGGCGFLEKAKWVQRRGGVALIVGDDTKGGSLVTILVMVKALARAPRTKANRESGSSPTTKATSTPTSHRTSKQDGALGETSGGRGSGFLHTLLSFVGLGSDNGYPWHLPEDSRRPPSSGSIDWVLVDDWDEDETSGKVKASADTKDGSKKGRPQLNGPKKSGNKPSNFDGDGFEIGVQDWRDPDLVPPKSSSLPKPSSGPGKADSKTQGDNSRDGDKKTQSSSRLKGGSITPGSGEYVRPDKSTDLSKSDNQGPSNAAANPKFGSSQVEEESWFSRHFHWAQNSDSESERSATTPGSRQGSKGGKISQISSSAEQSPGEGDPDFEGHEGLWVTLTPTSMSTSPFFDTLLVLVVSPLITLTVVYGLLLLRSRIRRRRWRAPKSVVDRLPVRTYHTIPSQSSTASSTPRSPSPGATSTSPLLGSRSQSASGRARPRSQTISGAVNSTEVTREATSSTGEKQGSGSSLWRRKYTGRQVECVVCLEEYIDGQSRVMSLPCGHEFHAECITPWLTTRRRTCPICKGDVVRSLSQRDSGAMDSRAQNEQTADDTQSRGFDGRSDSHSAAVPITGGLGDDSSLEHGEGPGSPLLSGNASAPQSSWRNFASLSFSALSGDTIWHQARTDRNR